MTKYHIDQHGMNGVRASLDHVLRGELTKTRQYTYDALDEAVLAYPDGSSPVENALRIAQARAVSAVNGVAGEAVYIWGVAVEAANEYLRADDIMAAGAKHREAAARDLSAFTTRPAVEAKNHELDTRP